MIEITDGSGCDSVRWAAPVGDASDDERSKGMRRMLRTRRPTTTDEPIEELLLESVCQLRKERLAIAAVGRHRHRTEHRPVDREGNKAVDFRIGGQGHFVSGGATEVVAEPVVDPCEHGEILARTRSA